ncbi:hypothetical protein OIE62_32680 [Streptomyces scopuliridis]|uniref:Uncharacterized protein n=1 Tax=Streptomyces scopuliridis TaxID=452529 RepID=A0ACD4ZFP3_9ACTN|nr:hypothetical protein [Streptomyces scopuliridis]WSB96994.1 hypothetical protein OG835_08255 [Streptomyces scopuliridis]WSC09302.1 hypothetical protein OIE62_32680 [Streptomyces scopuliridis]
MRITGMFTGSLLAGVLLLGTAGSAVADETPTPTGSSSDGSDTAEAPTEAGTSFRTATAFRPGQRATADGSSGDYLYWVFPADAGQRPTVTAKVTLPESAAARKGATTWQVDVYDGLRRRQPCMYGAQTKALAADARTVELRCTLRTVRAWAEPWSNDPLPGSYYVRLTVLNAQEVDLGLPVRAEIEAATPDKGGASAVGGQLAVPLTPGRTTVSAADDGDGSGTDSGMRDGARLAASGVEPEGGWSSGWWTDRWIWTVAGGVLGALAGIAGYTLARPSRRPAGPSGI